MKTLPLFPIGTGYEYSFRNGRVDGVLGDAPVIVSNGVGVDSVALLATLKNEGVRPDAAVTALVGQGYSGCEHRRFYAYLPLLERWMRASGFPAPVYVKYALKRKAKHFHYEGLGGNCLANRTLPSISFRRTHSCSLKYKGAEIDRWVTAHYGDQPCYRLVGYDCTEGHRNSRFSRKKPKPGPRENDVFIYPLQYFGMGRDDCLAAIAAAGLPDPGKSSCYICASMKPDEIDALYPDELWRIVIIEAHAQKNLKKIKGLWGHEGSMTDYIVMRGLLPSGLVRDVWDKWSADERPVELRDSPHVVADQVLWEESLRLAALCGFVLLPMIRG